MSTGAQSEKLNLVEAKDAGFSICIGNVLLADPTVDPGPAAPLLVVISLHHFDHLLLINKLIDLLYNTILNTIYNPFTQPKHLSLIHISEPTRPY